MCFGTLRRESAIKKYWRHYVFLIFLSNSIFLSFCSFFKTVSARVLVWFLLKMLEKSIFSNDRDVQGRFSKFTKRAPHPSITWVYFGGGNFYCQRRNSYNTDPGCMLFYMSATQWLQFPFSSEEAWLSCVPIDLLGTCVNWIRFFWESPNPTMGWRGFGGGWEKPPHLLTHLNGDLFMPIHPHCRKDFM